ncbi:MAG: hypothetical protein ACRC5R_03765 [Mycoplasmatales bacterium]
MRYHFKKLDSTSKYAKENIRDLKDFDYITCEYQTNGYGVSGIWEGKGQNIFYTLVFSQCLANEQTLPFVILLSIVEVISKYINDIYIKLPNDIFHDGKKLSGFIIEKKENCFLIGIGINVHNSPDEFTSLKKIKNQNFDLNIIYDKLTRVIDHNLGLEKKVILKNIKPYIKSVGKNVKYLNKLTLEEFEDECLDVNFQEIVFKKSKIKIIKYKELL